MRFSAASAASRSAVGPRVLSGMKSSQSLHLKTYFFIFLMAIFNPLGNLLLGKGMKGLDGLAAWTPAKLAHLVVFVMGSGTIWMGIASLIMFFAAYTLVLSWADYSYVQPASAMAYATSAALGHFVLREVVSPLQWVGIMLICLGVLVVGRTPPSTTERN
jgi:drug/metabolite transporter (DMT)-like permease